MIIDLSGDKETLLAGMKSKTRYNIKLSAKKGVSVRRYGAELLDKWYDIYRETGERDKISLHSYAYYRKIFEIAGILHFRGIHPIDIRLYMAESEGEVYSRYNYMFLQRERCLPLRRFRKYRQG